MSGHSKWANIKHRKGAQDKKRAKTFLKIIREITVSVRENGTDPSSNPRLRLALQNAKGANMPRDTIGRAIKKGQGGEAENFQEVNYEGYAPHGIAIYVETTTDNINRTVADIRAVFTKNGGNLGKNGSLEFIFDRKGVFTIASEGLDEDEFTLEAIDGGAEDVVREDDIFIVYTSFADFGNMQKKLEELGIEPKSAEVQRIPSETIAIDVPSAKKILGMIEKFEDEDDVQNVFHNLELTDELMKELENS